MKKIAIIVFTFFVLCGCSIQDSFDASIPSPEEKPAVISETPEKNQARSTKPSIEESKKPSDLSDDAKTALGLTPEIKEYIYGMEALSELQGYDFKSCTKAFDDGTNEFDLDGDGKNDEIKLTGIDIEYEEGEIANYNKLSVNINGQVLILRSKQGYFFQYDDEGMSGEVIDINKNDNKKELVVILSSSSDCTLTLAYIIIYDNGVPKKIGEVEYGFINPKFVNGTGFMVVFDKISPTNVKVYKIIKLKDDRTGFIDVPVSQYKTVYTSYEGDTRFDVLLASEPGGVSDMEIKKGTKVTVGYYDPKDYIEIRSGDDTLGWLNLEGKGMAYLNELFNDIIGS